MTIWSTAATSWPGRRTRRESLSLALNPWLQRPLGILGLLIVIAAAILAIGAPYIAPHSPTAFVGSRLESPNSEFLLGTNSLGQDVLSRTIYGAQVSMAVAFSATFLGVALGTLLGIFSGYFGGWVDLVTQRLMEVLASMPGLMLVLIVVAALGRPAKVARTSSCSPGSCARCRSRSAWASSSG